MENAEKIYCNRYFGFKSCICRFLIYSFLHMVKNEIILSHKLMTVFPKKFCSPEHNSKNFTYFIQFKSSMGDWKIQPRRLDNGSPHVSISYFHKVIFITESSISMYSKFLQHLPLWESSFSTLRSTRPAVIGKWLDV